MSLAIYAAPFESESNQKENIIEKKRLKRDKGLKRKQKEMETKKKIDESMVSQIGKIHANMGNEETGLSDFEPISRPESLGVNRTIEREEPYEQEENDEVENYDNLESSYSQQYYSHFTPGTIESMQGMPDSANVGLNENLVEKINYMIHLLEDNQQQKTEHVVEEMLLYFGLGVFMIYIVDSFTKIGKYTR